MHEAVSLDDGSGDKALGFGLETELKKRMVEELGNDRSFSGVFDETESDKVNEVFAPTLRLLRAHGVM